MNIVGDFNVDFTRDGLFNPLLLDFLAEQNPLACDLLFQDSVNFTYERDDGSTRSWIDHILCSESFHCQVSNVRTINSGSILSDHLPLCFQLNVQCLSSPYSVPTPASYHLTYPDWSKASSCQVILTCFRKILPKT